MNQTKVSLTLQCSFKSKRVTQPVVWQWHAKLLYCVNAYSTGPENILQKYIQATLGANRNFYLR